MRTLAEIKAAAEALSLGDKEQLLRFLVVRLRKERAMPKLRIYACDELAAMIAEDEAEGEKFRQWR